MGIWSNIRRVMPQRNRVRPPVAPAEVGLASPGDENPDVSAALLDTLTEEGTRRLFEQHGRETRKRGNRP